MLAFPGWGVASLVVLLSMGLLFAGIRSLVLVGDSRLSKGLRALSVVAGIMSLIFALLVLLFPGFAVLTLLILVSFGLVVYGFGRIAVAYMLKTVGWLRGLIVAVGLCRRNSIGARSLVLPGLALLTLQSSSRWCCF